ncbi:MAG: BamA/OMP85 family outer membrane protein, partial [Luteolibacter sp.]
ELNADGYWDAQVLVRERWVDDRTGVVDLALDCDQGPRCLIGEPIVNSVDGRGVKLVSEEVKPFVGKVATTANLNAMRLAAEEIAVSRGYPDSTVKMGRSPLAGVFVPNFRIDLGKRLKLNRVSVTGLDHTDPKRVLRRMEVAREDWYNEAAMNRAVRGLLATGAFSSARIETEEVGDKMVDATLHLTEAKAKEVGFAAGYGSYEGFIGRVSYADRNLLGHVIGLNSGIEISSRGLLGELRLTDPWFLGKDLPLSGRLYAFIYGHEGYDTREEGIEGKVIWKFGDHYAVDLSAVSSVVNLSEDGLPVEELGETVYLHQRVKLNQSLDYRDSVILPTKGWHLDCPVELGSAIGDISTSYARLGLSGGWHKRIHRFYDLGIGGSLGGIFPFGDSEDLPIDLRMFNGGSRSVRSFPNRELGPLVEGYPTGGEAGWNANIELMRNIWGSLRGVTFVDAGGLARNREEWGSADVELAAGLGLRLDLPIGPVRLEYGYNLTRDEGEPSGTLHFAIGIAY